MKTTTNTQRDNAKGEQVFLQECAAAFSQAGSRPNPPDSARQLGLSFNEAVMIGSG